MNAKKPSVIETGAPIVSPRGRASRRGRLVVLGTGIESVGHLTLGTLAELRAADVVFHHVFDRVNARFLASLNTHLVDLFAYYDEGKDRRITYIQMAEVILDAVRGGQRVVALFSGHPGVFVMASRRAVWLAREAGYAARLVPAISSIDCLFADLRVDPGMFGFQILKAGTALRRPNRIATRSHVALMQISSVGDKTYSFDGFQRSKRRELLEVLAERYSSVQEVVYYEAASAPEKKPHTMRNTIAALLARSHLDDLGSGILYVPPKGMTLDEVSSWYSTGYPELEPAALAALATHKRPERAYREPASEQRLQSVLKVLHVEAKQAGVTPAVLSTGSPAEWSQHELYRLHNALFSTAEAAKIVATHATLPAKQSEVMAAGHLHRKSMLFWLQRDQRLEWVFDRIGQAVSGWNQDYGYDLRFDHVDAAQLTSYQAGDHFGWHMDLGAGPTSLRKATVVIGLNDSREYEGGEVEIFCGDPNPSVLLDAGDMLIFPSYAFHRVKPVKSGRRWSLVLWVPGVRPLS